MNNKMFAKKNWHRKMFSLDVDSATAPPRGALAKASPHQMSFSQVSKPQQTHNRLETVQPLYKFHLRTISKLCPPNLMLPLNLPYIGLLQLLSLECPSGQSRCHRVTEPYIFSAQSQALAVDSRSVTSKCSPTSIYRTGIPPTWYK